MNITKIKLAYIGGGSRQWARVFMNDLALEAGLSGEIALYDIDAEAAERNREIGRRINQSPACLSRWNYTVSPTLSDALRGADAVVISILPGTFGEMASDVHEPEAYGIYQPVGDTVGPGGVLRAMRTVPQYETIAREIGLRCPNAWVLNLTNPMSVCTGALYDVFPRVKAFGCCHEVFHAKDFLAAVYREMTGEPGPGRAELAADVCGVNHFTWITRATYRAVDLISLLPGFTERFFQKGYCASNPNDPQSFRRGDVFQCGNKVKMDLFRRFGALGAAGDRHLAEFCDRGWYLDKPDPFGEWGFYRTPVPFRIVRQEERRCESEALARGLAPVKIAPSGEEAVQLICALAGRGARVSNVNLPNRGQMPDFPSGMVVETDCLFAEDTLQPLVAGALPPGAKALVMQNAINNDNLLKACRARDMGLAFETFMNQPLCGGLSVGDGERMFARMCRNTEGYLEGWKLD
ncbi:MAG TPA: alpha-glucosidase/alpha-galactosidase [Clostridia bacterium]|nr:alpha-glucosidase/alpha-galactosidase [Clostridia bacterium]